MYDSRNCRKKTGNSPYFTGRDWHGGINIKFMCIIAAPEGLERLRRDHPDIQIYVGHLDRCLNEKAYICSGLGDAGDRIFRTK